MTTANPLHDQAMAAFEDARRAIEAMPTVSFERTPITNRVLGKWARGMLKFEYGLTTGWDLHDWTSCGHVATPQLCYGLAHLPGKLLCAKCFLAEAAASENRCDWCGVTPPVDYLYPAIYPIGPALVLMTLCVYHVTTPDRSKCCSWPEYLRDTTHRRLPRTKHRSTDTESVGAAHD